MTSYKVVWEIEVDAKSPEEAARQALSIQRSREARRRWADLGFGEPSVFRVEGGELRGGYKIIDLGKVK
jgi:hypothetical protein